jgi:hypothetical protein
VSVLVFLFFFFFFSFRGLACFEWVLVRCILVSLWKIGGWVVAWFAFAGQGLKAGFMVKVLMLEV